MIFYKEPLMSLIFLNNLDTQEILRPKDILDTAFINMQDNGTYVTIMIIKISELMEETVEIHGEIFML